MTVDPAKPDATPMRWRLIASLAPSNYFFPNGTPREQITWVAPGGANLKAGSAPEFMAHHYKPERIHLVLSPTFFPEEQSTPAEEQVDLAELRRRCPNIPFELHRMPHGVDENELLETFTLYLGLIEGSQLDAEQEGADSRVGVHLDLTHGYRHASMMGLLAAQFALSRQPKLVLRISYAGLDMSRVGGPYFFELTSHTGQLARNHAFSLYYQTGRARELNAVLESIAARSDFSEEDANAIAQYGASLEEMSVQLLTLRVDTVRAEQGGAALVQAHSAAVAGKLNGANAPLSERVHEIRQVADTLFGGDWMSLLHWYYERRHYAALLTVAAEALVSHAMPLFKNYLSETARTQGPSVSDRLFALAADGAKRDRAPGAALWRRLALAQVPSLLKYARTVALVKQVRNDVNHAEQGSQPISAKNIIDRINSLMGAADGDAPSLMAALGTAFATPLVLTVPDVLRGASLLQEPPVCQCVVGGLAVEWHDVEGHCQFYKEAQKKRRADIDALYVHGSLATALPVVRKAQQLGYPVFGRDDNGNVELIDRGLW